MNKLREWIDTVAAGHKMLEESDQRRHYVGSCKDSFDDDGNCIVDALPWSTVSDLAVADENAKPISKSQFLRGATVPRKVAQTVSGHDLRYLVTEDDVYVLYDDTTDTHYFFMAGQEMLGEAKRADQRNFLYHVTDRSAVPTILQEGIDADSYWGRLPIIEYYIRMRIVDDPVIFRMPMVKFISAYLDPDMKGLQDPPSSDVIEMTEDDVDEAWDASNKSWLACLRIIGSVQYRMPMYVTEADILHENT